MIWVKGSHRPTLRRAFHLPFYILSSWISKELETWVAEQAKILESSTGWEDASRWCLYSYQCFLSCTQHFNSLTIHWLRYPLVIPLIFPYSSFPTFLNLEMETPHFSSSSSSFQLKEKETMYPQRPSRWLSQHNSGQLQCSMQWHFTIWRRASLATMQENNVQVAIERFLQVNTWRTGRSISINSYISPTPTSWVMGGLSGLGGGRWTRACTSAIKEGIR